MVHTPSNGSLKQREVVLLNYWLDQAQGLECGVPEVALAVVIALGSRLVAESALCGYIGRLVLAAENTACQWVVDDHVNAVSMTGRNDLLSERPGNGWQTSQWASLLSFRDSY